MSTKIAFIFVLWGMTRPLFLKNVFENIFKVQPNIVCGAIKQLRHCLLRTPDGLISVHNLHTVLLSLNWEN